MADPAFRARRQRDMEGPCSEHAARRRRVPPGRPDARGVAPAHEQPTTALLVVEAAQTSQVRNREKARDYATAGVAEYWTVDLAERAVQVHRRPLAGRYEEGESFGSEQSVSPLAAGAPAVDIAALLG